MAHDPKIAERADSARQILFRARGIVAIAAAAATSEFPAHPIATEAALGYASELLTEAIDLLDW